MKNISNAKQFVNCKPSERWGEEMDKQVEPTTRDRLMRAWENSMELIRDFETYSKRIENEEVKKIFKRFAEDEGKHASELRSMLERIENKEMN